MQKNNTKKLNVAAKQSKPAAVNINKDSLTKEFFKVPIKEDQESISVIASSQDIKVLKELGKLTDRNLSYFLRGAVKSFVKNYAAPRLLSLQERSKDYILDKSNMQLEAIDL